MDKLSENFLNEFFRLCFLKFEVYEVCRNHVKYEYIPDALRQYKKILKSIINNHPTTLPSFGVISQQYINDVDVQEAITAIREADITAVDSIINQLEIFIKNQRFKLLNDRVLELYSDEKDRKDEAIELQAKESVDIVNFSLKKNSRFFIKVFADFPKQLKENQEKHERGEEVKVKTPFGIDCLDDITGGGIDAGDTALWIARSGAGKSTALKWTGMYNCRLGYNVLHIQAEGSKQEAYNKYGQIWTKANYNDLKEGNFTKLELEKLYKYVNSMNNAGKELFIYAFEKFGEASMIDVREVVIDYFKVNGYFPDLLIIDSLDLIKTGLNNKLDNDPEWKKEKLDKVAQQMKDLCTEFYPMRTLSTTQASDFDGWNDPDRHLTRSNTEGNRTLVKPFSFVFTYNATIEEGKAKTARIYIDKFRNYKINETIYKIKTGFDKGYFYDRANTFKMYDRLENL